MKISNITIFLFTMAFTSITWLGIPQKNAFPHALPGTYSYITVYPYCLQYRLIVSGVDMCRLTGWGCEDVTPEDFPRLVQIQDKVREELARGIRISHEGSILPMRIVNMKALPIGFELLIECPTPKPLRSFILHYTLLADQKRMLVDWDSYSGFYVGGDNKTILESASRCRR